MRASKKGGKEKRQSFAVEFQKYLEGAMMKGKTKIYIYILKK